MIKEFTTLLPLIRKHLPYYITGLLCLAVTNAGELYIPQILRKAVDAMAMGDFSLSFIAKLAGTMAAVAAMVAAARFGWRYFIHGTSRRIENEMRLKLFNHLLLLSPSFYSRMKTGDIMARATNDMNAIRMATGIALVAFMDGMFLSLAILVILFSSYPMLTLYTILPLPIITVLILFAGREVGKRFKLVQEGFSRLSEQVQETISGIRVVKSFVKESYVEELFQKHNDEYKNKNMKLVRLWGFFFPAVGFISGTTILLLFFFGGIGVIQNKFTPGDFVAFMSYLTMLQWPVVGMGFTVNMMQRGAASLSRINAILDEKPEIISPRNPVKEKPSGDIEFKNLTYSYSGYADPVLEKISFTAQKGRTLGILGRTGSGKSTLIRLIPRLIDPPGGTVFIGGIDVKEYKLSELRKAVAVVPQDTFLFSASIRENIAFGVPDTAEEMIREGADISTISRELDTFPHGWDTQVGERGVTLSGGQKQRIALSRAILADSDFIILDDSMASVDTETEEKILSRFFEKRKGRTNIIVSHRVSTLKYADRIIVLDRGRLVQEGTHRQLLAREGLYREIHVLQQAERRKVYGT